MSADPSWPCLDVRVHEYRIGEVTARLSPTVLNELVGAGDTRREAMLVLARELQRVADALRERARGD